jgi:hypothetical protein
MGSGCAQLNKFVNPKSAGEKADEVDAKVEQAIQNGDLAVLKKVCKDKKLGQSQVRFTTVNKACVETGKLMSTEIAGIECDKIDAYWENAKEMDSEVKGNLHNSYGLKLAECDRWDTLFVELMHWGQAWDRGSNGYKLIAKLDEAGEPVEDKFLNYLETTDKPLAIEHSAYAMSHFLKWRMDTEEGKSCGAYVPAMDKLDAGASHNLLVFFKEESCKEAASSAVSKLAADSPSTRIVACQLLGKVGDKSHLKKVEIVAKKDGYSKEKKLTVVYPVRDACSQAMAKIELRQ